MTDNFGEYDSRFQTPAPLTTTTETHAKLKRNLDLALDVHHDLMQSDDPKDKRIVLDAANATVKAALTTDRTALKARQDNTLERVLIKCLFYKQKFGGTLTESEHRRLASVPRAKLEEAVGLKAFTEENASSEG